MTQENENANATVRLVTVDPAFSGQRLDNFLTHTLKGTPRTLIYRIVRKGEVRVNKGRVKPDYRVASGDIVRIPPIRVSEEKPTPRPSERLLGVLKGRVVYDKNHLLVVNKPAGLASHGGSGIVVGLIEALRAAYPEHAAHLELAHRLDRDTSGLIMVSAHRPLLRALHAQLREGQVDKRYWALLSGQLPGKTHRVEAPLLKVEQANGEAVVRVSRDGKAAITVFTVLERFKDATLVEARLVTGRTHQIRVHAQHLGHALVGDQKYGRTADNELFRKRGLTRLFLHARELRCTLPNGEKLQLLAEPDDDFMQGLSVLRHG